MKISLIAVVTKVNPSLFHLSVSNERLQLTELKQQHYTVLTCLFYGSVCHFLAASSCHGSLFILWWRPSRISSVVFEAAADESHRPASQGPHN